MSTETITDPDVEAFDMGFGHLHEKGPQYFAKAGDVALCGYVFRGLGYINDTTCPICEALWNQSHEH